ncbi:Ig-like domain-containing protein, partial [Arthrobacter sp. NPDC055138]
NPITATTWNFTTEAAPAIAGRTPAVNGTNVATNRNLAVTFSEPVRGVSSSTVTLKTSAGKKVPATVTYDAAKRTVTVKPMAILPSSTRFTVSLSNGITDVNGNRLAASSWSFKTESRPTVSKRTHASGAKSINRSRNIHVKFSEAVSGVSGSSFKLVDNKGKTVSAKVSYNSRTKTATLNPSSKLKANATYKVRLSSSIKDASGNRLSATNWSFRTGR